MNVMLDNHKRFNLCALERWEDQIKTRKDWIRRGWVSAEQIAREMAFYQQRVNECRQFLD